MSERRRSWNGAVIAEKDVDGEQGAAQGPDRVGRGCARERFERWREEVQRNERDQGPDRRGGSWGGRVGRTRFISSLVAVAAWSVAVLRGGRRQRSATSRRQTRSDPGPSRRFPNCPRPGSQRAAQDGADGQESRGREGSAREADKDDDKDKDRGDVLRDGEGLAEQGGQVGRMDVDCGRSHSEPRFLRKQAAKDPHRFA